MNDAPRSGQSTIRAAERGGPLGAEMFANDERVGVGMEVEPEDLPRLRGALRRVAQLMCDGQPRTLEEIAEAVGCSQPGAGARLRDLRRAGWRVDRVRVPAVRGLYDYRATPPDKVGRAVGCADRLDKRGRMDTLW